MSLYMARPSTPDHLLSLSKALSDFVNTFDMAPKRDIVVYCFDSTLPTWEQEPAAWHRPTHGDIVINLGIAYKSILTKKHEDTRHGGEICQPYLDSFKKGPGDAQTINARQLSKVVELVKSMTATAYSGKKYYTYDHHGAFNRAPLTRVHRGLRGALQISLDEERIFPTVELTIARTIMAMLLHETAHSVFSQYITEPWLRKLNGYERQVMVMFEELRAEDQQLRRISTGTSLLRYAADVVVDPGKIAEDIRKKRDEDDGEINIANFALNSTLTLGRLGYGIFHEREVRGLVDLTTDLVGSDRYEHMHSIWKQFRDVRETNPERMTKCVQEWVKLFPSASDGSNTRSSIARMPKMPGDGGEGETESEEESSESSPSDTGSSSIPGDSEETSDSKDGGSGDAKEETVDLPGLPDSVEDEMKKASETAEDQPEETNKDYSKRSRTPSQLGYAKASHANGSGSHRVRREKPSAADLNMASKLSRELENLNLSERGKFVLPSATPPGRLRPRAMVTQAADRANGRSSTAMPFKRAKHTHDFNPPLTAGILTDVSGSQSWAEMFSARTAFILSRAISSINGKVAAATFGDDVVITTQPGEHPIDLMIVSADGGTEQFDHAAGTLDTILRLTTGSGIRLLFVITDGDMVKSGEMRRTAEWVDTFHKAGVSVIWITPAELDREYYGYPTTPKNATAMQVDRYKVRKDPSTAINQVARTIKKSFAARKR